MWIIAGIVLTLAYVLLYCLCAMSARCSRAEEAAERFLIGGKDGLGR